METPTGTDLANEASEMFTAMCEILHDHHAFVQGAVLADLLAMWLVSHYLPDDVEATKRMRERILEEHIKAVRNLIVPNEKLFQEQLAGMKQQQH